MSRRRIVVAATSAATVATALALVVAACGSPSSGKSGAELFSEHCARCHADDGSGDPRQLSLAPALDLTRSVMVARGARGLIYQRITQGYGTMPAFSHKLQRGDVEALAEFVLRFQEK